MAFTDPVFQWLAYELAAIFAIIAIWLIYRMSRKSRKIAAETRSAVNTIKESREERRQQLSETLHSNYGFDGDTLAAELDALMARERELHKYAMSVFVGQDSQALANLNTAMQQQLDAGLAITPISLSAPSESTQQVQQLAAENAELTATISRLTKQLEQAEAAKTSEPTDVEFAEAEIEDELLNEIDPEITAFSGDSALFEDDVNSLLAGDDIELAEVSDADDVETKFDETEIPEVAVVLSDEVEAQLIEEALPDDMAEYQPDQLAEQMQDAADEDSAPIISKSRLAEFANASWNATVPDIYGKSPVIPAETAEAEGDEQAEITVIKSRRSLNDFLKQEWQSNTPDIYGKPLPLGAIDAESEDLETVDAVSDQVEVEADLSLTGDEERGVAEATTAFSDAEDLSPPPAYQEETQQIGEAELASDGTAAVEQIIDDVISGSESAQQTVTDTESVISQLTADALAGEDDVKQTADLEAEVDNEIPIAASAQATEPEPPQNIEEAQVDEVDASADIENAAEDDINTSLPEQAAETEMGYPQGTIEAAVDENDDISDFETEANRLTALMAASETSAPETDTDPVDQQSLRSADSVLPERESVSSAPAEEKAKTEIEATPDALEKLRARLRQKTAALTAARALATDPADAVQAAPRSEAAEHQVMLEETDVVQPPATEESNSLDDALVESPLEGPPDAEDFHWDDGTIETQSAAQNSLLDALQATAPADESDESFINNDSSAYGAGVLNPAEAMKSIEEDMDALLEEASAPEPYLEDKTAEVLDEVEIPAMEASPAEADITVQPEEPLTPAAIEDETVDGAVSFKMDEEDVQADAEMLSVPESEELTVEPGVDETPVFEDRGDALTDETLRSSATEATEEKTAEASDEVEIPAVEVTLAEANMTTEHEEALTLPAKEDDIVDEAVANKVDEPVKLSESQDMSEQATEEVAKEIEDFAAALLREEALAAEERARTEAEIAGFEKQVSQPALPEQQDISDFLNELDQLRESQKTANQLENQAQLNAAADTPLPEQTELDKLMDEVRTLQSHTKLKPVSDQDQQTALRSILSNIPSFAETKSRRS